MYKVYVGGVERDSACTVPAMLRSAGDMLFHERMFWHRDVRACYTQNGKTEANGLTDLTSSESFDQTFLLLDVFPSTLLFAHWLPRSGGVDPS